MVEPVGTRSWVCPQMICVRLGGNYSYTEQVVFVLHWTCSAYRVPVPLLPDKLIVHEQRTRQWVPAGRKRDFRRQFSKLITSSWVKLRRAQRKGVSSRFWSCVTHEIFKYSGASFAPTILRESIMSSPDITKSVWKGGLQKVKRRPLTVWRFFPNLCLRRNFRQLLLAFSTWSVWTKFYSENTDNDRNNLEANFSQQPRNTHVLAVHVFSLRLQPRPLCACPHHTSLHGTLVDLNVRFKESFSSTSCTSTTCHGVQLVPNTDFLVESSNRPKPWDWIWPQNTTRVGIPMFSELWKQWAAHRCTAAAMKLLSVFPPLTAYILHSRCFQRIVSGRFKCLAICLEWSALSLWHVELPFLCGLRKNQTTLDMLKKASHTPFCEHGLRLSLDAAVHHKVMTGRKFTHVHQREHTRLLLPFGEWHKLWRLLCPEAFLENAAHKGKVWCQTCWPATEWCGMNLCTAVHIPAVPLCSSWT